MVLSALFQKQWPTVTLQGKLPASALFRDCEATNYVCHLEDGARGDKFRHLQSLIVSGVRTLFKRRAHFTQQFSGVWELGWGAGLLTSHCFGVFPLCLVILL